ncbi:MAG: hypothetical protein KatS3mg095_0296 [Candidatus Parcubacteria bacterium]|nr:MAG: hypothetical protein KatS3mg095_0296 [Candidatus Parcubacteria bacterium]
MAEREIKIKINGRIFWYLIFVFLIIFLVILAKRLIFTERYVGVYFLNGELYIGKISYFPKLKLTNPYILRFDQQTNNTILVPLTQLSWSPKNEIFLNKNQILWIAPLNENSQSFNLLKNQEQRFNQLISPASPPPTMPSNNTPRQQSQPEFKPQSQNLIPQIEESNNSELNQ